MTPIRIGGSKVSAPSVIAIDTNVVVGAFVDPNSACKPQAKGVIEWLTASNSVGVLVPRVVNELLHRHIVAAAKLGAKHDASRRSLERPLHWNEFLKRRPQIVETATGQFTTTLNSLNQISIIAASPNSLVPYVPDSLEEILVEICSKHHLDATDGEIISEVKRAGLDAIVSVDSDLLRASTKSVRVFTW